MRRITPRWAQYEQVPLEPTSSFRLLHSRGSRGYGLRLHYHPEIELTLIIRSQGMRFVGDSVQPFEAGDLCLIGENLLHSWYTDDQSQRTQAIVIQFSRQLLERLSEQWPELRRLPELATRCSRGLAYSGKSSVATADLMRQAAAAPESSIRRFAALLQILDELVGQTDPAPVSASSPLSAQPNQTLSRFQKVMETLHERMPQAPRQSELASQVGMTSAGFSRFFHRMVGRGYVDYVNAWRVSLACRELLQRQLPVTQIAFDCGFTNLSNFNRRFIQYKRMTPREYRAVAGLA